MLIDRSGGGARKAPAMRVGILDIMAPPTRRPADLAYRLLITKQFASITPQAISVWCRRLGHDTFYAVYYGAGDARRLLPPDLDVVFIACYTQASPIASQPPIARCSRRVARAASSAYSVTASSGNAMKTSSGVADRPTK